MKEVLKYTCEHCKREYKVKTNAENHENICWKNPKLKTCITCLFFDGFDYDNNEFSNERYIVCLFNPDLIDSDKPRINCDSWIHDKRSKSQKKQEKLTELVKQLNETGLTF